jgi:hypothetical protein
MHFIRATLPTIKKLISQYSRYAWLGIGIILVLMILGEHDYRLIGVEHRGGDAVLEAACDSSYFESSSVDLKRNVRVDICIQYACVPGIEYIDSTDNDVGV